MFKLAITALVVLGVNGLADPVADKDAIDTFSLESWANDIIANPEDTHLSPDAASKAVINQISIGKSGIPVYQMSKAKSFTRWRRFGETGAPL